MIDLLVRMSDRQLLEVMCYMSTKYYCALQVCADTPEALKSMVIDDILRILNGKTHYKKKEKLEKDLRKILEK